MIQADLKKLVKARLERPGETSTEVYDFLIQPATREALVALADVIAHSNKAADLKKKFTANTDADGVATFTDPTMLVWSIDEDEININGEKGYRVADLADLQSSFVSPFFYYYLDDNTVTVRGKTPGTGVTGLPVIVQANYVPTTAQVPQAFETDLVNIVVDIIQGSSTVQKGKNK